MRKSRENLPTTTVAKVQVKVLEFQAQEDHPTLQQVKIQLDLLKEGKDLMTVDQVPWFIFLVHNTYSDNLNTGLIRWKHAWFTNVWFFSLDLNT